MSRKKVAVSECRIDTPPETLGEHQFYGMHLNEEQKIFANAIWSKDIDIIFCNSKAGTGKTTIAAGVANLLVKYGFFSQIYYIMSPYGERKKGSPAPVRS